MARFHYASTKDADMRYLVGTAVADPFFCVENGEGAFAFLSVLEIGSFREHGKKGVTAVPLEPLMEKARAAGAGASPHALAKRILARYGPPGTDLSVSAHLPLDMADALRADGARLRVADPFLPERAVKSPEEVAAIRESCARTALAFLRIEEILRESAIDGAALRWKGEPLTSERLKREAGRVLFDADMENADGIIISSGAHAAMPHHAGEGLVRPHATIVCDIFPRSVRTGYFADMTRTYVKGEPSETAARMYAAVAAAQDAGFAAIRAGVEGKDAHQAAAAVIRDSGFGAGEATPDSVPGFIHGLGHGLGLEVHEPPRMGAHASGTLTAGNVVTVEPGLYHPEHGGVRIEDVVLVTEDGCEKLSEHPRELVIA
ncbi:Xaa-Pro peptidase family protein [Patescibacteria group bacterium]|nr:Xaa-Pro peptidase family protein [Patescibacteria group bacterium]